MKVLFKAIIRRHRINLLQEAILTKPSYEAIRLAGKDLMEHIYISGTFILAKYNTLAK